MNSHDKNHLLLKILPLVLVFFSVIGVTVTHTMLQYSQYYWLFMFVVFGAVFSTASKISTQSSTSVVSHIFHWLGAIVGVLIVYAYVHTGRITQEQAGLLMLLVLAMSTYMDGLRINYRFWLVGVFLALIAVVIAYLEEYIWPILIASISLLVLSFYLLQRSRKQAP